MSTHTWRRLNNVLFAAILVINSYVIATPFLPTITFWWQQRGGGAEKALTQRLETSARDATSASAPNEFHADATHDGLIIPKMLLDTPLVEGPKSDSYNLLNKGAWRLPFSTTPEEGGNTVIAGHRFSYTGPRGIFYFLNKLAPGDDIGLWHKGRLYRYSVESTRVHAATDTYVQESTDDDRLTLYTCTPLWNPTQRLVVVAKPKGDM